MTEPQLKVCTRCKEAKPHDQFSANGRSKDRLYSRCKPCKAIIARESNARVKAKDPEAYLERWRQYRRRHLYGMSDGDYENMLAGQENGCAICRTGPEPKASQYGNVNRLNIDHCHDSGAVRGLLCGQCNIGLGAFKDSRFLLETAIVYLEAAV